MKFVLTVVKQVQVPWLRIWYDFRHLPVRRCISFYSLILCADISLSLYFCLCLSVSLSVSVCLSVSVLCLSLPYPSFFALSYSTLFVFLTPPPHPHPPSFYVFCDGRMHASLSYSICSMSVGSVVLLKVLQCRLTQLLGTSWDQCRSMVQYSFTSTETIRLVRTDSPWRPHRLSHRSWTMNVGWKSFLFLYWVRRHRFWGWIVSMNSVVAVLILTT